MRIFVISDTHFFHQNILKFHRGKFADLQEMHDHMIKEWNSVVSDGDIVIHLGDVAMQTSTKKNEIKEIMSQLNGDKMLVLGNHDIPANKRDRHYWNDVGFKTVEQDIDRMVIGKYVFSHVPVIDLQPGQVNIHGHIHGAPSSIIYGMDHNRINVNIDAMNSYKPMDITDMLDEQLDEGDE